MTLAFRFCVTFFVMFQLSACASVSSSYSNLNSRAVLTPASKITHDLLALPLPKAKVIVAVYGLRDQTGQYKAAPDSSFSNSVTQGSATMLVKALKDSGWYTPVEREGLQNLLTERKIIRAVVSPTEKGKPNIELPSLLPASLIIEGALTGFDTNVRTGGAGANYLGIGGNSSYSVDQVTLSLRMVDIRTGEIVGATTVTKTIYSYMLSSGVFAFTSFKHLLQAEVGFSVNEPVQLCVQQALEAAVIHLTLQGVRDRYLTLKDDQDIFTPLVQQYLRAHRDNVNDDDPNNAPMELIGFRDLPSESYLNGMRPSVLLPPAQRPAVNYLPENIDNPAEKPNI